VLNHEISHFPKSQKKQVVLPSLNTETSYVIVSGVVTNAI
jgi:hypothetical protein